MTVPRTPGLVTPYAGLSLGEGSNRTWRAGTRWQVAPEATFGPEAAREEDHGEEGPSNAALFRTAVRR